MAKGSTALKIARVVGLRLLYGLVSLLFLSLLTFLIDEVAPGDAALVRAGEKASVATIERIRKEMGLDRPWPVRYVEYIGNAARGDFGNRYSYTKEPVVDVLKRALPMTLMIAVPAIFVAAIIGLLFGTIGAIYRTKWPDQFVLGFSTLGVTLPNFVLGPVLVLLFANRYMFDFLPSSWEANLRAPVYYYLLLPVIVLAARPTATLTRLTRESMIDTLGQEFIKLARAKGVPSWRLYLKHGLRNAILPVVTAIGTSFGYLLTGSFIVESIFTMPGMGFTAIDAIQKNDTPVVIACVMLTGALFILANLIVDVVNPLIDPRIRESQI